MNITKARDFIITERVDLSKFHGGEEVFITIREPKKDEIIGLYKCSDTFEQTSFVFDLLPKIIVSHNFCNDKEKLISNEEVADYIYERSELWQEVNNSIALVLPRISEEDKKK
jgi:hypothetical protein